MPDRPTTTPPPPASRERTSSIPPHDPRGTRPSRLPTEGGRLSDPGWLLGSSERPSRSPTRSPGERPWYLDLPKLPGESPFHIKGIAYKGLLQYVTTRAAGGLEAFLSMLPSPQMRDFFSQPFLAASFYDILPLGAGSAVLAVHSRLPVDMFAQQQGRAQAKYDVEHAYRALLQGRSYDDLHSRLRPLAGRYFNFGEFDIAKIGGETIRVTARGLPSWLMPWFVPMHVGYFTGLVASMDCPNSFVEPRPLRREGVSGGMSLVTLELDLVMRGERSSW